jgi:tRNA dimethylallyltransferase
MKPRLLVVAGPTASGKTAAAVELARRLGGELVGCDSVQVYRGFDVGSAKPTPAELGGIPHHLVDVADPDEAIDAMRYADLADAAIASTASRGRAPIVVGGTGLWLRALLRGLVDLPAPDPGIRARLEREARELGSLALHARLRAVDPRAAAAIHENDELRIVRALEVHEQTGEALGDLRAAHALGGRRYPALVITLDRPRDELYARIDARIDAMISAGWKEEVERLLARWGRDVRAFGSVGYREMAAHVADGVGWDDTVRAIRKSTRVYTRRQRTWLASDPDVSLRIAPADLSTPDVLGRIDRFLRDEGEEEEGREP